MRKLISILFVVLSLTTFAQKFTVTPNGLRDSEDEEKNYVVIEVDGLTAKQLYDNTLKYITKSYNNPDEVLKGQIEGDYIKFDTYVPEMFYYSNSGAKMQIDTKYTTELKFKDNKVRLEIVSLDMYHPNSNTKVLFSGGIFEGYVIYKKNGTLFKEEAKQDIENYFNSVIEDLKLNLKGESEEDNW